MSDELLTPVEFPERQFRPATGGLDGYALAYSNAARELAGNHEIGGVWALPVVFLYRHAIELLIKATLRQAIPLDGVCQDCVLKRLHSLKKQLPDLCKIAELHGRKLSIALTNLISAWHKHDNNGMKARYPVTMDGKSDLLKNAVRFNLRLFVADCEAAIEEMQELLALAHHRSYAATLESEGLPN